MSNAKAVHDFVDHWRGTKSLNVSATGNCSTEATVTYSFAGKTVEETTTATFIRNGYDDGKVSLLERGALSADLFHLDFAPKYQKYRYNKADHTFLVEGESPKMHGPYTVVIAPR
jgi:hypothetical protein